LSPSPSKLGSTVVLYASLAETKKAQDHFRCDKADFTGMKWDSENYKSDFQNLKPFNKQHYHSQFIKFNKFKIATGT
jgi:hypothetical protein